MVFDNPNQLTHSNNSFTLRLSTNHQTLNYINYLKEPYSYYIRKNFIFINIFLIDLLNQILTKILNRATHYQYKN